MQKVVCLGLPRYQGWGGLHLFLIFLGTLQWLQLFRLLWLIRDPRVHQSIVKIIISTYSWWKWVVILNNISNTIQCLNKISQEEGINNHIKIIGEWSFQCHEGNLEKWSSKKKNSFMVESFKEGGYSVLGIPF